MTRRQNRFNQFQSTLSMRRATIANINKYITVNISIHALHEESDNYPISSVCNTHYFNPRSP